MLEKINNLLSRIKQSNPLILNLTNNVTIDFVANGLLSLGASPVMSQAEEEINDLIQIASAVIVNIGTLNKKFIELCEHVCKIANQLNKPIILDPVGVGASLYRTSACETLLKNYRIAVLRGNASEIGVLCGFRTLTKGVDSTIESEKIIDFVKTFSERHKVVVCVSGKIDVIVEGNKINLFNRGSQLMPMVTGTGCLLSAVIGAFQAVEENYFEAVSVATLFYGICGEIAAEKSKGPGSFRTHFLDALNKFCN